MRQKTRKAGSGPKHLKRRTRRRSRRQQRGGNSAAPARSVEEWARRAVERFDRTGISAETRLGEYVAEELTLTQPSQREREETAMSVTAMTLHMIRGDREELEDLRDCALRVRDVLIVFTGREDITAVSVAEFRDIVRRKSDPTSPESDDTTLDSLTYLLLVENALRFAVGREPLRTIADVPTSEPVFLLALAVNIRGDANAPSLFMESPIKPTEPAVPAE